MFFSFFFFIYGIASVHFFYFNVVMKFADIVAVIIGDMDDDCFSGDNFMAF